MLPAISKYSAKVDTTIDTITFSLSCSLKPLSFNLGEFFSITGLNYSEIYVDLPSKETVRAGSATLGLRDEKNPQFSSQVLINKSTLRIKYVLPIWRLLFCMWSNAWVAIRGLMISLMPLNKAQRCEYLLHKVTLTSYMIQVANLLNEPKKTLILSTEEVNADNIANKSLSGTVVQRSKPKKTVTETQHAEKSVATTDTTKSLEASELAEKIANHPETIDTGKVERGITLTLAPKSARALSKKKLLIKQGKVKLPSSNHSNELEMELSFVLSRTSVYGSV
ncbi:hypothetical protein Tco_0140177 [Tanacetum coccineum]